MEWSGARVFRCVHERVTVLKRSQGWMEGAVRESRMTREEEGARLSSGHSSGGGERERERERGDGSGHNQHGKAHKHAHLSRGGREGEEKRRKR